MASAMLDRPVLSAVPTQQKRGSSHLTLPSTTKRLKTDAGGILSTESPVSSPAPKLDRTGQFKAEKWFNDTNQNATKDTPFADDDPPFYVDRQPSSDGHSVCAVHSDGSSLKAVNLGKPTAPTRSLLAHMESSESNSDDYRSVIDDLTIQNKKLKKKLKQYEKLHCSHLEEEKLFEVRIHSLAGQRKRELEQTLRSFASSIEDSSQDVSIANPTPLKKKESRRPKSLQNTAPAGLSPMETMSTLRKHSSASTSCSKPIDSAYASMSGLTGNTYQQLKEKERSDRLAQASQKQRSVRSYLHEIPETLIPRHTMAMSNQSKSKLVVKKLEQLFTGKGEARRHTQSHQQQEVSNSAAEMDLSRLGRGRPLNREGMREAHILPDDADLQVDSLGEANRALQQSRQNSHNGRASTRDAIQSSRDQSPDQRPTRPLDLDLHRAQVPAENINYIRHLGLSSPTVSSNSTADDGWVYLNLLTSMAQLHTLNVTPDFIRRAIANVSAKFELSQDGTKVRWLGGAEGSKLSSDSDDSLEVGDPKAMNASATASKYGLSGVLLDRSDSQNHEESNTALPHPAFEASMRQGNGSKRMPVFLEHEKTGSNFHYKPLFYHGGSSDDSDMSGVAIESNSSSDMMEAGTGMTSGINSGSHGVRESEVKLRKHNTENGPIIFYHKARFCTDLSGDINGAMFDETAYHRYTQTPLGCELEIDEHLGEDSKKDLSNMMDVEVDDTETAGSLLDFDDLKSCISGYISSTGSTPPAPAPMEVSGLGGVQPDDNFMVKVQVRHQDKRVDSSADGGLPRRHPLERVSRARMGQCSSMRNAPRSQPVDMPFPSEIISTATTDLEPSSLPPPSYACLPFSSSESGNDDDEDDEDDRDLPVSSYNNVPHSSREVADSFAPRTTDFLAGSSSDESKESGSAGTSPAYSDDDDDDSIDLLAHARVLDPDTVAEREREFESNVIPVESAAATAGESSSVPTKPLQRTESEADSMSVDGECGSSMDDSD